MSTTQPSPLRVLVIDDDPRLLESITDGLELLGEYAVIQATDGAVGLDVFFRERPDCVVVDIRMPELDGYQFIRAVRGDPETAQTPMIILSALSQDRDQLLGHFSGADVYLFKPVDIDVLLQEIERVFQMTAASRAARLWDLTEVDADGRP